MPIEYKTRDIQPFYTLSVLEGLFETKSIIKEVFADDQIVQTLKKSFFIPDFRPSTEAQTYLKAKRDSYAEIIDNIEAK